LAGGGGDGTNGRAEKEEEKERGRLKKITMDLMTMVVHNIEGKVRWLLTVIQIWNWSRKII
jgi:hypothetical protein